MHYLTTNYLESNLLFQKTSKQILTTSDNNLQDRLEFTAIGS